MSIRANAVIAAKAKQLGSAHSLDAAVCWIGIIREKVLRRFRALCKMVPNKNDSAMFDAIHREDYVSACIIKWVAERILRDDSVTDETMTWVLLNEAENLIKRIEHKAPNYKYKG